MSMLDSFFRQGFKGPKCKTLLKLTIPRIKLLRNRREIQIKQMRRDIAKLLETGQEATARIRVEHIIREENMMAAQEILELFCELISVRIPIIETQRECPLDLKEAISTVCFAAPRCADLPELMHVQMLFASKYGKEFVAAASELRPDCGVNRQIIELLSVRAPAPERKMKLLTEIAEEHGLDWDPTSSETEMLKQPEDLLNGPSQFVSGSMLPLPKEKHEETLKSIPSQSLNEQHGADSDSDELDFPEVPKVSVRTKLNPVPPAIPAVSVTDNESTEEEVDESTPHQSDPKQEETTQLDSGTKTYEVPNEVKTGHTEQYQAYTPPVVSPSSFSAQSSTTFPSLSEHRSDVNVDLQDVLAAAQAAAESAERAASAARSAASLAQMRISQLIRKNSEGESESISGFSPHEEVADELITAGKGNFNHQQSFSNSSVTYSPWTEKDKDHWEHPKLDSNNLPDHAVKLKFDSYGSFGNSFQPDLTREQPHRSTSMEDDPFSYPDLFSSKRDNDEPGDHSLNTKSSFL